MMATTEMHDESPQPEDLEALEQQPAYCPDCGAEVFDLAEFCPQCGEHIAGRTTLRHPVAREFRQRWIIFIAIIVLIAFILTFVL